MMKFYFIIILAFSLLPAAASPVIVHNANELERAVKSSRPGDTILMAGREWKDAALMIEASGTKEKPVVIMPQNTGGAMLTGQSYLRISGDYLVISGLHFNKGYTPRMAVIEFCTSEKKLANHCRVTQCVIENYSQPARLASDIWVCLWGKRNRVDHNTFVDKLNMGPVLVAELNDERSQDNYHSVDSNYFKGRQRLGANGGETIRIGVSRYSLSASHTQIVHNYFERCNGEVEIVSIKSGENNISHNLFYECEGGLVLRHGSKNVVNGNVFLGNNQPFTGGVRVINPGHIITNNLFKDLAGINFRSALAVLNGVPHSLINRYYQVTDVTISHNTFINCASILFGAGKDEERTLSPQRVVFSQNLLVHPANKVYDDQNNDGGVIFSDNGIATSEMRQPVKGFSRVAVTDIMKDGIKLPYNKTFGADVKGLSLLNKNATGAVWYYPDNNDSRNHAKTYAVSMGEADKINETIHAASPGDTIVLTDTGYYKLHEAIQVNKPVIIEARNPFYKNPVLVNVSYKTLPGFVLIENGGSLIIKNIDFNGAYKSYGGVEAGIRSASEPMNRHYSLWINGCRFYDFNESAYAGFKAAKGTYADSVIIENSLFRNISGTAVNIAEEKEDKGLYGAENTVIRNCVFTQILGPAVNLYRGGNDESTTGPAIVVDHCTFNEVNNMEQGVVIKLIGVQNARVMNSMFNNSGRGGRAVEFREYRWDDIHVDYCNFYRSGKVESFYNKAAGQHTWQLAPGFINPSGYNFNVTDSSLFSSKSSDGKPLGASLLFQ